VKISKALNLVLPLYHDESDASPYAYVHSMPVSVSVFDVNFRLMIRTYEAMIAEGASALMSAHRFLKAAAESMTPSGSRPEATYMPLLNEIERLSVAIVSTPHGWDTVPLAQAISGNLLDDEDATAAVNSSVFFTVAWHVPPKNRKMQIIEYGTNQSGAVLSPLSFTDWITSLPTSIATVSSGATAVSAPSPMDAPGPAPTPGTVSLTV
jgi:hypothetical protein